MGSRSGHSKLGWSHKVGPTPTCKETQGGPIPTIRWKTTQVEGWMSLSHGLKSPSYAGITSNRLQTTLEELLHTIHHIMAVDPKPGDKFLGRSASLWGRSDQFNLAVTPTNIARGILGARSKVGGSEGQPASNLHATRPPSDDGFLNRQACIQDKQLIKNQTWRAINTYPLHFKTRRIGASPRWSVALPTYP
jgi:hypothetical protein